MLGEARTGVSFYRQLQVRRRDKCEVANQNSQDLTCNMPVPQLVQPKCGISVQYGIWGITLLAITSTCCSAKEPGTSIAKTPANAPSSAKQTADAIPSDAIPTAEEGDTTGEVRSTVDSLWTRKQGEDWPRMLGVHFDSRSSEKGIRTEWGPKGLPLVWSKPTGIGYGNGVASKGRFFQFDRFGGVERLNCYRAETGEPLWSWDAPVEYRDPYGYNNGPRCSPVVDGDYVYTYGVAGRLSCVQISDGKPVWTRDLNTEYRVVPNFFGVGASPVIYGDFILAMVGGSPKRSAFTRSPTVNDLPGASPDGSAIVAFHKLTGEEVYRVGNYLASYSAPVIAKLDGVDHCVALVREGLLVFRAIDGSGEQFFPWRAAMLESVNAASPLVFDGKILISEAYEIGSAMLQWRDGKLQELWRDSGTRSSQSMRTHWNTPLLDGNILFASSGRNQPDTDLRALQLEGTERPKLRWSQRNRDRGTALIVESHFLWLGETGKLQLIPTSAESYQVTAEMDLGSMIDPNDGKPLVDPPSWAPPVLSHGLLFIRGSDKLLCLELIPPEAAN